MVMKKVNCELVCHFKEKLSLRVVFSLGFDVENNLNAIYIAIAQRHSLAEARSARGAKGLPSPKSIRLIWHITLY